MTCFDLTHPIESRMPVYPGKEKPVIKSVAWLGKDGYREWKIETDGHTGTHIDSPAHMLPGGRTLDKYPVSHFSGNAAVLRIPEKTRLIGKPFLEMQGDRITASQYLLLVTGWSRYWGRKKYLIGYPVLTEEAAMWLGSLGLKGIGLDAISVDPFEATGWPIHHILFQAGMVIVENLIFPAGFNAESVLFQCFPLPVTGADGIPVRAVAFV
jgi:kynurenine formamidase